MAIQGVLLQVQLQGRDITTKKNRYVIVALDLKGRKQLGSNNKQMCLITSRTDLFHK